MLRAALIGFPAVGKTTLFRLMTSSAEAREGAKRQEAHVGVARVPDPRLDRLVELYRPRRRVPATVELAEMAGHTATRSLLDVAPFRNADALLHVVRSFRDERVPHEAGSVDPLRDARTMEEELILADLGVAERRLAPTGAGPQENQERRSHRQNTPMLEAVSGGARGRDAAAAPVARSARRPNVSGVFSSCPQSRYSLVQQPRRSRPSRQVAGMPRREHWLTRFSRNPARRPKSSRSAPRSSSRSASSTTRPLGAFRTISASRSPGSTGSSEPATISSATSPFFTVGDDECRAWTVPRGTAAQDAAGEIHTDISRGFIRAEVVAYADLSTHGSLSACRDRGLVRLEGKEYVVDDGDVINFRFAP